MFPPRNGGYTAAASSGNEGAERRPSSHWSLEVCAKEDWEALEPQGAFNDSTESKKAARITELDALAEPLPDAASRASLTRALEEACKERRRGAEIPRRPPKELQVRGLPNTGTNAYQRLLGAPFNVTVLAGEKTGRRLWKHILPSHPDLRSEIIDTFCPSDDVATVFVVRHPVAWLLSQTSPGHNYGHLCEVTEATGDVCFFSACHVPLKQWCAKSLSRAKQSCGRRSRRRAKQRRE